MKDNQQKSCQCTSNHWSRSSKQGKAEKLSQPSAAGGGQLSLTAQGLWLELQPCCWMTLPSYVLSPVRSCSPVQGESRPLCVSCLLGASAASAAQTHRCLRYWCPPSVQPVSTSWGTVATTQPNSVHFPTTQQCCLPERGLGSAGPLKPLRLCGSCKAVQSTVETSPREVPLSP